MAIITVDRYSKGEINRLESFGVVIDLLEKFSKQLYKEKQIRSFFGYGSAYRGDHNLGSDIDCSFITNGDNVDHKIAKFKTEIFREYHIVIEDNTIEAEYGIRGDHTIIPSFRQHLENIILSGEGRVIGENPLLLLKTMDLSIPECARNSLVYRLSKFRKKRTGIDDEDKTLSIVKTIIEEPYHIARIFMQNKSQSIFTSNFSDTKGKIKDKYKQLTKELNLNELNEFLEVVSLLKSEYINLLQRRIDGNVETYNYIHFLRKVEDYSDDAFKFFQKNLDNMN